jgi:hypothetical protein
MPDFGAALARFEAWWRFEPTDRALIHAAIEPDRPYQDPRRKYRTHRERWMDVEFIVDQAIAQLSRRQYMAETFPIFWPNLGPVISASLFGCAIEFSDDTSWSVPIIQSSADWARIADASPDFSNEYWQTIERMTDYALERCDGRFLIGITDLHGNYDILASLRGTEQLCLDLVDDPQAVRRAGDAVARGFVEAFKRSYNRLVAGGGISTCWVPFVHKGPAFVPSCDFWCLVSGSLAREMILPDLLTEMRPLQRSIFHLDGPGALHHLDLLLEIPQLNAVQWVYGDGNGPARRWIEVYRRILTAGKSVQVLAEDPADALAVLDALGPRGVWLCIKHPFTFTDRSSAEAFVTDVARRSQSVAIGTRIPAQGKCMKRE